MMFLLELFYTSDFCFCLFFFVCFFKQMFSRFIEGRSFVSSQDSLFAFFDNCLEKVTRFMCRILFGSVPH